MDHRPRCVELAYRLYGRGAGRSLVLLHGAGANLVSIDQYAERLGDARTVVSLDLRACEAHTEVGRRRLLGSAGQPDSAFIKPTRRRVTR